MEKCKSSDKQRKKERGRFEFQLSSGRGVILAKKKTLKKLTI